MELEGSKNDSLLEPGFSSKFHMTTESSVKKAQTEIVHYFFAPLLGGVIFKTEMVYQKQENVQWKTLTEVEILKMEKKKIFKGSMTYERKWKMISHQIWGLVIKEFQDFAKRPSFW